MSQKELAWVDFLKKKVAKGKGVIAGIGDDCALVQAPQGKLLLKSDLFIENVHFKLGKIDYRTLGIRAVARVLSDFAACSGVPKFIGVSAGIPKNFAFRKLKSILDGILYCSKKYKFSLIGGDTSISPRLFLDVWGLGTAKKCILRSTAKTGDYIFLSGPLGKNKLNSSFEPKIKEAQFLTKGFKINSLIDISDGFILDLYRILSSSKKGAFIREKDIPLSRGQKDLYRGEDYELIFTVDKHEKRVKLLKEKFYYLGRVMPKEFGFKIERKNKLHKAKVKGYLHF